MKPLEHAAPDPATLERVEALSTMAQVLPERTVLGVEILSRDLVRVVFNGNVQLILNGGDIAVTEYIACQHHSPAGQRPEAA